jgi:transposase
MPGARPGVPKVLGIDEHFFTRKKGYATTFCDFKNHRIYDVMAVAIVVL